MFENGLYHPSVYMPFAVPIYPLPLVPSRHAIDRAFEKGIIIPREISASAKVVECEYQNGSIIKVVYRQHYDARRDVCIVVSTRDGVVRTVWPNYKNDKHNTLNRAKYVQPPR